jgi:hypothetical protein
MGKSVSTYHQSNTVTTAQTLATIAGITIPDSVKSALVSVETQAVRYREDGTNPTAAIGHLIAAGGSITFDAATLRRVKLIQATATAVINITFYKS